MKAYDIVKTARDINRISTRDVIQALCQEKFIWRSIKRERRGHYWWSRIS